MAYYGNQDHEYGHYGQAMNYGHPLPQPPQHYDMRDTSGYMSPQPDLYHYSNSSVPGDAGERKLIEQNSIHSPQNMSDHRDHYTASPYFDDHEDDDIKEQRHRSCCCSFFDCLCCGCCTCCPRWLRYISCCLLIIIVALGIAVGVLAAIFKTPEVNFNGLSGEPQFNFVQTTAHFAFNLNITVNNPNVESVTFETIVAKAFYPGYPTLQLGGGQVNNTNIISYGITTIIFPFTVNIDAVQDSTKAILSDVLRKCGLGGGQKQDISINYDVTPTIRIIGIPISPTISGQASFACPDQVQQVLSNLGSLGSLAPLIEGLIGI